MGLLHIAARFGRLGLVIGLFVGFAAPGLALALKPWLGVMVAFLLSLTAFRVGATASFSGLNDARLALAQVCGLQILAPLCALGLLTLLGAMTHPFAMAVVLMLAAPSISGAPNLAIMMNIDPAPVVRIMVLGTLLFPITMLPSLAMLPAVGGLGSVAGVVAKFVLAISAAVGLGFGARRLLPSGLTRDRQVAVDGLAAITLAVVVVGLMSAIGPLARTDPGQLVLWLGAATLVNFGMQVTTFLGLKALGAPYAPAVALIAGNRNIALFLLALPTTVIDPLLVFIGCYQVPMYLTPLVFPRLYRTSPDAGAVRDR